MSDMLAVAKETRGPATGKVRMTFDMPEELRRRVKVLAAIHGKQMKDLLLEWVAAGIEVMEKHPPRPRK